MSSAQVAGGNLPKQVKSWQLACLAVGSLLVIWLIVRSMAVLSAGDGQGDARFARAVAPDSAAALIGRSGIDNSDGSSVPTAGQLAVLRRAATRAPLRYEPFLAASIVAQHHQQWLEAERSAEAARDRQPRAVAVRGILLQSYLQEGQYGKAIGEMNAIVARSDRGTETLMQLLTLLADNRNTAGYVQTALNANPRWRSLFVDYASREGTNKQLLFQSLIQPPAGVSASQQQSNQTSFINALVNSGDYEKAYLAWINFLPHADVRHVAAIYDGDFRGYEGPPPFNWSFASDAAGAAERTNDSSLPGKSALDVQFFGTGPSQLASELLFVTPGNYSFSALAEGTSESRFGGTLYWELTCLPSNSVIQLAQISSFPSAPFRISKALTVPAAGCSAQRLVLRGQPGDISALVSAQFTGLKLAGR